MHQINLVEICVAANRVSEILAELEHYGVTRFTLYPDITQVKDQINLEIQEEGQLPSVTASSIVNVSKTGVNLSI
ncbi:hypothetical protein [Desulfosporosinus acididurans]|uniref:hypothetical protein n=1 Tax=Desulfosporosinus acididurans TaxID=476652 RepID=UPI001FA75BB0|nr:hypothetical protein [Desulfosporosinus acididurans]